MLQLTILVLLLASPFCWTDDQAVEKENVEALPVSELLERANSNLERDLDTPELEGDIVVEKNADPCTTNGCLWPKFTDGKVYIPYRIQHQFTSREKAVIERALQSFSSFSCIRFRPTIASGGDWISIESHKGCYTTMGRLGGKQLLSLSRQGCVYHHIIQHELLHVLGFNHEQVRSDRDKHIKILLENVIPGKERQFAKKNTLNLGTPYDYNSVMHYGKTYFSDNGKPTMVAIPDPDMTLGRATQVSSNDIIRLNRLYRC